MKLDNFFKKYMSLLLITIIFTSTIPLNIFASPQKNVRNLKIISNNENNGYSLKLSWENPEWDTDTAHQPQGFKVYEKKATNSGGTETVIQEEKGKDLTEINVKSRPLNDGTIYEYKVVPYHTHQTDNSSVTAPEDTSTPKESVLFLTDIKVEAVGSGNTLTVTFDNPKYNGKNLFTGYKIYYQKGGANVKDFKSHIELNIDDKNFIPSYDSSREVNRLTYQITNNNIEPGNIYAVKVEPIFQGKEIRANGVDNANISIENESKIIGFNKSSFREYRTNDANVSIRLDILEDGKDFLKLKWGDISGVAPVGNVESVSIYSGESENAISDLVGVVYSQDAIKINSWRIAKPSKKTYYQLRIKVQNVQAPILSEIAIFDPTNVNITPNKPIIYPQVKIEGDKSLLNLYWEVFIREPYNKEEEALVDKNTNKFIDKNVLYDVWITDSNQNLNKLGLPKILDRVSAETLKQMMIKETQNPVYNYLATKYYTVDEGGSFLEKDIEENKVYYIKIVAIKPTTNGFGLESQPAETQIYIPAREDISKPNSLSKPPLRVKKDENGKDLITQTEIPIEWNTKWFEIYDVNTDNWYSEAAIKNGELIFGEQITEKDNIIKFYDLPSAEDVKQALKNAGYQNFENILVRKIDISQSNIKYELIAKSFDEINLAGGYEEYVNLVISSEGGEWKEISPKFSGDKYAEYSITELKENTRYVILLRPYRILKDGRKDAYPTYILATTLPKDTEVDITPVTPTLEEVSKTDVSIDVAWKDSSNGISYELAVNEILIDDPAKANKVFDGEEIKKNSVKYTTEEGEPYLKYTIKGLFPDTGYYIWIRAKVDKTEKQSDWSNPIYVKTEKLRKPNVPNGLGLASEKNVGIYNAINETKYVPLTSNYLIIEWLRDAEDLLEEPKANKTDKAEALLVPEIKNSYMVKFNELLANKDYYVRAKTKVYVSKGKDGNVEKLYSYIVQLSRTNDFKDYFEIEVPEVKPSGDKVLTEESNWTTVFRFKTKKSTNADADYDGNIDDKVYPLPEEDFEIYYDGATQTLVYRFRSNKKDGNGNNDNLADQRFITKLINQKIYDYKIDLTSYLGYNIKNRRVEVPFSIIKAFEERKIALSVVVNGTTFKLNAGFLNTQEVKSIGFDNKTTILIDIMQSPISTPTLQYNQTFTSYPQQINISINKNGALKTISYLGQDMNVDIKLNSRTAVLDNNVSIYKNNKNEFGWKKVPSLYNSEKGSMALKTKETGFYSTIATSIKSNDTNGNLSAINSKIIITDLVNANLNSPISVVQFNNIVAGVANGKKEISINNALSTTDFNSLKNSKMLLNGSVVSKEAGVSVLVKLYEIKTKSLFNPISNINTTPYKDIIKANKAYQLSLIKAGDIGFFGDNNLINPKSTMTINEMLYMVNIILEDSGL